MNESEMRRNSPDLETTIALLPTPGKADGDGGHLNSQGHQSTLPGVTREIALLPTPVADHSRGYPSDGTDYQSLPNAVVALLPTPAVNDMGAAYTPEEWDEWTATMKAKHNNGNGHGKSLNVEAQRLLPTPSASDFKGSTQGRREEGADRSQLDAVLEGRAARSEPDQWGEYGPAIRRWEQALGRPAPEPTKAGAKGNPKLSDEFDEWLMGYPKGWITDVPGVTWNEALKACGNGVVPRQGAEAVRWLLTMSEVRP